MKVFDTSGQLLVALGIDTGTSNTLSVLSNAVSVLSQNVSVLSQSVSALSQRQSVLSNAVSVLSNQVSVLSNSVSVLSNAVSLLSQNASVLSNAVSVLSNAVSVMSQSVSVLSNTVSAHSLILSVLKAAMPGGRLTLTSSTPVMTSAVVAAVKVFYTPYVNDILPIFDGTAWQVSSTAELQMSLDSSVHVSSTNYDVFAVNDAGTRRIGTGPAWASNTARALSIVRQNGLYVNASVISALRYGSLAVSAVASAQATYLGTFRTTGTPGQTEYSFGSLAASAVAANLLLWNAYNRVPVTTFTPDATDSWTYGLSAWRAANNSTTNRCSFVRGLDEDAIQAVYWAVAVVGTDNDAEAGVGLDTVTSAIGFVPLTNDNDGKLHNLFGGYWGIPGIGFHFVNALERCFTTGATSDTFYGDGAAPSAFQTGMTTWMMT